jgi:hypothetical protein
VRPSWLRLGWLGVLGIFLVSTVPAWALQGFGVSPTSQEVELAPGASTHGELTIINDGDVDVAYKLYATDYAVTDEAYHGAFDSSGKAADVSPVTWFSLPKVTALVKARAQVKVAYGLIVPKTASVGGHYAAVFAETVPPPGHGGAFISRVERVGSLFYVSITGDLKRSGSVLPLSAPWLQSLSPVGVTLRLRNSGNVHFLAEGTAQLSTPFGKAGKAEAFRGEVLPGTTRRFDLSLPAGSPIGLYNVTAKVTYLGRTEERSRWVLLVPKVTFMIVSATVLLLLVLGFWGLMRRARRR